MIAAHSFRYLVHASCPVHSESLVAQRRKGKESCSQIFHINSSDIPNRKIFRVREEYRSPGNRYSKSLTSPGKVDQLQASHHPKLVYILAYFTLCPVVTFFSSFHKSYTSYTGIFPTSQLSPHDPSRHIFFPRNLSRIRSHWIHSQLILVLCHIPYMSFGLCLSER